MDFELDLWANLPDAVILEIFSFLPVPDLLTASQTCKSWYRVAMDDFLWKDLFYFDFKVDRTIGMAMGKESWQAEYKRLYYHTPLIESEVIREHRDQVLHVSFSHNGKMFATSSKDGFIKVWNATYPATVRYHSDLKEFTWKYTQFSQFNENDSLLLVSGVHFGSQSTSGEIAVFNLQDGFELQCRVLNKPYDIFGTWYNDAYLLSGNLHWMGHLTSYSTLWLNKASQALDSEQESVVMPLFKLYNVNASSIRTIMIANCTDTASHDQGHSSPEGHDLCSCKDNQSHPHIHGAEQENKNQRQGAMGQRIQMYEEQGMGVQLLEVDTEAQDGQLASIEYNNDYRMAESEDFKMAEAGSYQYFDVQQNQEFVVSNTFDVELDDYEVNGAKGSDDLHKDLIKRRCVTHGEKNGLLDTYSSYEFSKTCCSKTAVLDDNDISQILQGVPSTDKLETPTKSCFKVSRILEDSYSANDNKYRDLVSDSTDEDDNNDDMINYERTTKVWDQDLPPLRDEYCPQHRHSSISAERYCLDNIEQPCSSDSPQNHEVGNAHTSTCPSSNWKINDGAAGKSCDVSSVTSNPKEKYLIFTTGMKTYTPHQIGIKKIGILEDKFRKEGGDDLMPNVENNVHNPDQDPDTIDHLIELHGHIIGMCLSPDHRYLYVNSRPWPQNYTIEDPLYPPPIAQEIDIHVIDLQTMQEVGTMHRAHKAYTPNDECFFIFLDVCGEYVASGAEDKHGYLWDRHYGVCLAKFAHSDVVNSVAFKPSNPEILVTASDDFSIKIWRSRNEIRNVKHGIRASKSTE